MERVVFKKCPHIEGHVCLLPIRMRVTYQNRKIRFKYLTISPNKTAREVLTICNVHDSIQYQNACSGNPNSKDAIFIK